MRIRIVKPVMLNLVRGVEIELDIHQILAIVDSGNDDLIEAVDRSQDARELESLIEAAKTRHLQRIERIRSGWRS